MFQKRLASRHVQQLIHASIEPVKLANIHGLTTIAQDANGMQQLVAMRGIGPLSGQPDDETFQVAAKLKQHPLSRKIDWRDLEPMARSCNDQCVGGQLVDSLMDRRSADPRHLLQILKR